MLSRLAKVLQRRESSFDEAEEFYKSCIVICADLEYMENDGSCSFIEFFANLYTDFAEFLHFTRRRYDIAQDMYLAAIELNSKLMRAWRGLLGALLDSKNMLSSADSVLRVLIEDGCCEETLLVKYAEAQEEPAKRMMAFQQVLKFYPRSIFSMLRIASLEISAGRTNEAYQDLQYVLQIDPINAEANKMLGIFLLENFGNLTAAAVHLIIADEIEPLDLNSRACLALVFFMKGDWFAATKEYSSVISVSALQPLSENISNVLVKFHSVFGVVTHFLFHSFFISFVDRATSPSFSVFPPNNLPNSEAWSSEAENNVNKMVKSARTNESAPEDLASNEPVQNGLDMNLTRDQESREDVKIHPKASETRPDLSLYAQGASSFRNISANLQRDVGLSNAEMQDDARSVPASRDTKADTFPVSIADLKSTCSPDSSPFRESKISTCLPGSTDSTRTPATPETPDYKQLMPEIGIFREKIDGYLDSIAEGKGLELLGGDSTYRTEQGLGEVRASTDSSVRASRRCKPITADSAPTDRTARALFMHDSDSDNATIGVPYLNPALQSTAALTPSPIPLAVRGNTGDLYCEPVLSKYSRAPLRSPITVRCIQNGGIDKFRRPRLKARQLSSMPPFVVSVPKINDSSGLNSFQTSRTSQLRPQRTVHQDQTADSIDESGEDSSSSASKHAESREDPIYTGTKRISSLGNGASDPEKAGPKKPLLSVVSPKQRALLTKLLIENGLVSGHSSTADPSSPDSTAQRSRSSSVTLTPSVSIPLNICGTEEKFRALSLTSAISAASGMASPPSWKKVGLAKRKLREVLRSDFLEDEPRLVELFSISTSDRASPFDDQSIFDLDAANESSSCPQNLQEHSIDKFCDVESHFSRLQNAYLDFFTPAINKSLSKFLQSTAEALPKLRAAFSCESNPALACEFSHDVTSLQEFRFSRKIGSHVEQETDSTDRVCECNGVCMMSNIRECTNHLLKDFNSSSVNTQLSVEEHTTVSVGKCEMSASPSSPREYHGNKRGNNRLSAYPIQEIAGQVKRLRSMHSPTIGDADLESASRVGIVPCGSKDDSDREILRLSDTGNKYMPPSCGADYLSQESDSAHEKSDFASHLLKDRLRLSRVSTAMCAATPLLGWRRSESSSPDMMAVGNSRTRSYSKSESRRYDSNLLNSASRVSTSNMNAHQSYNRFAESSEDKDSSDGNEMIKASIATNASISDLVAPNMPFASLSMPAQPSESAEMPLSPARAAQIIPSSFDEIVDVCEEHLGSAKIFTSRRDGSATIAVMDLKTKSLAGLATAVQPPRAVDQYLKSLAQSDSAHEIRNMTDEPRSLQDKSLASCMDEIQNAADSLHTAGWKGNGAMGEIMAMDSGITNQFVSFLPASQSPPEPEQGLTIANPASLSTEADVKLESYLVLNAANAGEDLLLSNQSGSCSTPQNCIVQTHSEQSEYTKEPVVLSSGRDSQKRVMSREIPSGTVPLHLPFTSTPADLNVSIFSVEDAEIKLGYEPGYFQQSPTANGSESRVHDVPSSPEELNDTSEKESTNAGEKRLSNSSTSEARVAQVGAADTRKSTLKLESMIDSPIQPANSNASCSDSLQCDTVIGRLCEDQVGGVNTLAVSPVPQGILDQTMVTGANPELCNLSHPKAAISYDGAALARSSATAAPEVTGLMAAHGSEKSEANLALEGKLADSGDETNRNSTGLPSAGSGSQVHSTTGPQEVAGSSPADSSPSPGQLGDSEGLPAVLDSAFLTGDAESLDSSVSETAEPASSLASPQLAEVRGPQNSAFSGEKDRAYMAPRTDLRPPGAEATAAPGGTGKATVALSSGRSFLADAVEIAKRSILALVRPLGSTAVQPLASATLPLSAASPELVAQVCLPPASGIPTSAKRGRAPALNAKDSSIQPIPTAELQTPDALEGSGLLAPTPTVGAVLYVALTGVAFRTEYSISDRYRVLDSGGRALGVRTGQRFLGVTAGPRGLWVRVVDPAMAGLAPRLLLPMRMVNGEELIMPVTAGEAPASLPTAEPGQAPSSCPPTFQEAAVPNTSRRPAADVAPTAAAPDSNQALARAMREEALAREERGDLSGARAAFDAAVAADPHDPDLLNDVAVFLQVVIAQTDSERARLAGAISLARLLTGPSPSKGSLLVTGLNEGVGFRINYYHK